MLIILLQVLDIILFFILCLNIIYLAVFSIASHFRTSVPKGESTDKKHIAILIPSYQEDTVIRECVDSCLNQNYPSNRYDIVVISDRMSDHTNESLQPLPIKLIRVHFENSTKSKALNFAMQELGDGYDLALILDADNTIAPNFLSELNSAFSAENVEIVQTHRCAKNINTPLALLDAVSEEINNSIFRKGHANLGFSAALIGSGMCFEYKLLKNSMLRIDAVGGFDRALELMLLKEGRRFHYLPDSDVLDEKVQRHRDFSLQRRRWISAQLNYLSLNLRHIPAAIRDRKFDFCDKIFQQMSIPRIMLLGFITIIAIIATFIDPLFSIKWWVILAILIATLIIAIPKNLLRKGLLKAIVQLPYFFILMAINLFRLKGANKKFIHTKHGIK